MRYLLLFFLIILSVISFAQTDIVFIGKSQTEIRAQIPFNNMAVDSPDTIKYMVSEGFWLSFYFDDNGICQMQDWITITGQEEALKTQFEKDGWKQVDNRTVENENYFATLFYSSNNKLAFFRINPKNQFEKVERKIIKPDLEQKELTKKKKKKTKSRFNGLMIFGKKVMVF